MRTGPRWIPSLNSAPMSMETITVEDLIELEFELQQLNYIAGAWFGALKEACRGGARKEGAS